MLKCICILDGDYMIYQLGNETYNVEIIKKGNKNTYIRIKEDLTIQVTTNFLVNKSDVKALLDRNTSFLEKTIEKRKKELKKNESFNYLGKKYDIVIFNYANDVDIEENKIYVKDLKTLEKWYKKQMIKVFSERLEYNYNLFEENIPFPKLKTRNMKTRWGVCNRKTTSITLNTNLMKESIDKIDYVIIHELSHLVYFDHSNKFWSVVGKYCPKYKQIRKEMRE